jgi:hypothetical protein
VFWEAVLLLAPVPPALLPVLAAMLLLLVFGVTAVTWLKL